MKRQGSWILAALAYLVSSGRGLRALEQGPGGHDFERRRFSCQRVSCLCLRAGLRSAVAGVSVKHAAGESAQASGVIAITSYQNDVSPALRDMEPSADGKTEKPEHEANENPRIPAHHKDGTDGVVQNLHVPSPNMPAPILNFDGIPFPGVACNCAPPDTDGEVGATQYVQIVNEGFQVFNKTTGVSVLGPVGIYNALGRLRRPLRDRRRRRPDRALRPARQPLAHQPVRGRLGPDGRVHRHLHHERRHRRLLPVRLSPGHELLRLSQDQRLARRLLHEHEHLQHGGHGLPRPAAVRLRTGEDARRSPGRPVVTTGITDGPTEDRLPARRPGRLDAAARGRPGDVRGMAGLAASTRSSTCTPTSPCPPTRPSRSSPARPPRPSRSCAPRREPACPSFGSATNLDGIGDRLMHRLAYRNFGDHESVVGNFSVLAGGVSGIRWFEMRNVTAGPVTIFQESTYQPDTTWRWMGSAAMDNQANLAIGFSASSPTIIPQIRYAGRLSGDPINTLAQGEAHLFDGTGSQIGHRQPLGRLQRPDRRSGGRLHVLVHPGVLRHHVAASTGARASATSSSPSARRPRREPRTSPSRSVTGERLFRTRSSRSTDSPPAPRSPTAPTTPLSLRGRTRTRSPRPRMSRRPATSASPPDRPRPYRCACRELPSSWPMARRSGPRAARQPTA